MCLWFRKDHDEKNKEELKKKKVSHIIVSTFDLKLETTVKGGHVVWPENQSRRGVKFIFREERQKREHIFYLSRFN